jgi:HAMP domain-containing protein
MGVFYPPSLILVISVLALILIGLHFSLALTRVKRDQTRLAQELALLRDQVDNLQNPASHINTPPSTEEETTG